ncbi:MAG TPA: SurA N-terminal domain-containing protein, partial [Abditibacteriaceae bacterium]|nr:SurA N-terminal domain-containing protein [Abditibacteriaceae bacterium]
MADKDTGNDKKLAPTKTDSRKTDSRVVASRAQRRASATRPAARKADETYASSPLSMGSIRSGALHSMGIKIVLGLLIVIFAVGFMFTSFGGNGNPGGNQPGAAGSGPDPVARVGSQAVTRAEFDTVAQRQIDMMKQYGQPTGVDRVLDYRKSALDSLAGQAALVETARSQGITVSADEIDAKINELIEAPLKGQGTEAVNARRQIEAEYGSIKAYEDDKKSQINSEARDGLERQLLIEKLEKKIKDENKVTEAEYKQSVTKLKLRQIVIRPAMPGLNEKDAKGAEAKNQAAAQQQAAQIAARLQAKPTLQNFLAVARQETARTKPPPPKPSPGGLESRVVGRRPVPAPRLPAPQIPTPQPTAPTQVTSSDLGWKLPADLPLSPAPKDAVLQATGNLVGPVQDENTREVSFFWIEGRKPELPKDYAKTKAQKLEAFETERDEQAWTDFQEKAKKQVAAQITDPLMEAYKIQKEQLLTATGGEANRL